MYTLLKALMLFMVGTQAVAIAIPKDPKSIKALEGSKPWVYEVEGDSLSLTELDGRDDSTPTVHKRFDIHDLNRKVSFKPVVHEEEAYALSLPEVYRKRSALKKLFPFYNPLNNPAEAGPVEEKESHYLSLPDVWERDDNAPTARRRSKLS